MAVKRRDLVTLIAEKIATSFFLAMLNPRYRGPKFQFDTCDIDEYVRNHIGMNLPTPPSAKELNQAGEAARRIWARMIEEVGDGIPRSARNKKPNRNPEMPRKKKQTRPELPRKSRKTAFAKPRANESEAAVAVTRAWLADASFHEDPTGESAERIEIIGPGYNRNSREHYVDVRIYIPQIDIESQIFT